MLTREQLADLDAELQAPAAMDAVAAAEAALGHLPLEYKALLAETDGLFAADRLRLYSSREVVERNTTFEVAAYLPGFVLIGDDSGGHGVLMSEDTSGVWLADLGGLFKEALIAQASTLESWCVLGFPLHY